MSDEHSIETVANAETRRTLWVVRAGETVHQTGEVTNDPSGTAACAAAHDWIVAGDLRDVTSWVWKHYRADRAKSAGGQDAICREEFVEGLRCRRETGHPGPHQLPKPNGELFSWWAARSR